MVTSDQISTFFNIYRHESVVLTQFHLIPSSTKLHWPSTTMFQPLPPHTDPVSYVSFYTTHFMSHAQYTWSSCFPLNIFCTSRPLRQKGAGKHLNLTLVCQHPPLKGPQPTELVHWLLNHRATCFRKKSFGLPMPCSSLGSRLNLTKWMHMRR